MANPLSRQNESYLARTAEDWSRIVVDYSAEIDRLRDWLHYIQQTTSDDNARAAVELAYRGEAVEWDDG